MQPRRHTKASIAMNVSQQSYLFHHASKATKNQQQAEQLCRGQLKACELVQDPQTSMQHVALTATSSHARPDASRASPSFGTRLAAAPGSCPPSGPSFCGANRWTLQSCPKMACPEHTRPSQAAMFSALGPSSGCSDVAVVGEYTRGAISTAALHQGARDVQGKKHMCTVAHIKKWITVSHARNTLAGRLGRVQVPHQPHVEARGASGIHKCKPAAHLCMQCCMQL